MVDLSVKHYVTLAILLAQNVMVYLLLHAAHEEPNADQWSRLSCIILQEFGKIVVCLVVLWKDHGWNAARLLGTVVRLCTVDSAETIQLAIPGVLYAVSNLVLYYGIEYLGAPVAQTLGQLKILVTAALACAVLQQRFSSMQIGSLVGLAVGAGMVTAGEHVSNWLRAAQRAERNAFIGGEAASGGSADDLAGESLGVAAVLLNCLCGGLASIYFEYILKRPNSLTGSLDLRPPVGKIAGGHKEVQLTSPPPTTDTEMGIRGGEPAAPAGTNSK